MYAHIKKDTPNHHVDYQSSSLITYLQTEDAEGLFLLLLLFSLENQEMKMPEEPTSTSGNVWESHKFFLLNHRQYYCAACISMGE